MNVVEIRGAKIVDTLNLEHVTLPFRLSFDNCYFANDIQMSSSKLAEFELVHTDVAGDLVGEGMQVEESVSFQYGFHSRGNVHLVGANIGGFLGLDGALLDRGLTADRIHIHGSVLLRAGFQSKGEVRLLNATIDGSLSAIGGSFLNPNGVALEARGAQIGGDVFLNHDQRLQKDFTALSQVSFRRTEIQGDVSLNTDSISDGAAVVFEQAIVNGSLDTTECGKKFRTQGPSLVLTDASVAYIHDRAECWAAAGKLYLDGLRYRHISKDSPTDAASRLKWIRLEPRFTPDAYGQLARFLRDAGDPKGAKIVLINLERDRHIAAHPGFLQRGWDWLLDVTTAYGYEAWRAAYLMIGIYGLGIIVFALGFRDRAIVPTDESAYETFKSSGAVPSYYPAFSSAIYALDTLLPVISLGQRAFWAPNVNDGRAALGFRTGALLRVYLLLHIGLGWLLTTLVVAGVTGLLKSAA